VHVLVANNKEKFLDYCKTILLQPEQYDNLRKNAAQIVRDKYSWDAILSQFDKKLKELTGKVDG